MLFQQFLFAGTHMRDDIASEAYEDELDMGRSGSYLNSSITSAWSEHSLDPEDIRVRCVSVYLSIFIVLTWWYLLSSPKILSHGSFLLQTPDEMGHLSSINGCGVRSCDSLWEKRTNVSRDFCLSVRAEEVSLPKDLGTSSLFTWGMGIMMTSCRSRVFIVSDRRQKYNKFKTWAWRLFQT